MEYSQQDIQEVIFFEASLLDDGKLEEWLSLYTEDSLYWIPSNDEHSDPETHVSIVYEKKEQLTDRVSRLNSGIAYGQLPASKILHVISNVQITEKREDMVIVRSHAIVSELRRGVMNHYPVKYEHHIVSEDGDFKIKFKKTTLLNLNEYLGNLSFIF